MSRLSTPSPPEPPTLLKRHLLNPHQGNVDKKEDSSVLLSPSHSVLGHLGIRMTTSDGLIATTVTMRYKHKVRESITLLTIQFVTTILYRPVDDHE
jgi:5'-AMP-activated protein kinase beta subunit, interaction domain